MCANLQKGGLIRGLASVCMLVSVIISVWAGGQGDGSVSSKENGVRITVYSSRHYAIDQKVYDSFTLQTGIAVDVIEGSADELIERVVSEGANTDMDVLFFSDAGRLSRAKERDILLPISPQILALSKPIFKDKDDLWVATSARARVIVYDIRKEQPNIQSYEDLSKKNYKILIRSSSNLYNISLLSDIIYRHGTDYAHMWTEGLINNFARSPEGSDRDQMRALIAGHGDVAIVNTYYIGLLAHSSNEKDRAVGNNIGVIFPSPTHINVSGVGISKNTSVRKEAEALVAFWLSREIQTTISEENYEYPVVEGALTSDFLEQLGQVSMPDDNFDFNMYGKFSAAATEIADIRGWK